MYDPGSGVFDAEGNYYFSSPVEERVRKIDVTGIITTVAGTGIGGYNGDSILATTAQVYEPTGITLDSVGNLYIADVGNNRIRRVDRISGIITTIAGNGMGGFGGDSGLATAAMLYGPQCVRFDKSGNIYIGDYFNNRGRKITTTGIISTFVGTGISGYSGDGSLADTAKIGGIADIRTDTLGNIYLCDNGNSRIFKIAPTGIISTIAGTSMGYLFNGDDISATTANIDPYNICFDDSGYLYIAENQNYRVRKIDAVGVIHTVAGNGIAGSSGEGGLAINAELYRPNGLAFDQCGNLYIPESNNARISKVTFNSVGTPIVSITTARDSICLGTAAIYTVIVTNGYPASYKWIVNGVIASTGSAYTYTPENGDSIHCVVILERQCFGGRDTISSNSIHMIVSGTAPELSITGTTDTTCAGTLVSYTATTTGADSVVYTWYVNGVWVSTASGDVYTYTPASGDHITCKATGTNMCNGSADTLVGNIITMFVNPVITSSVSITSSTADTICAGTSVTFTATSSGGGPAPLYQWIKNGSIVDTGSSYTYTPANGDSVRCVLTGSNPCTLPASISSHTITMLVNPVFTPSVAITSTADTICAGTSVTFTATSSGGGTVPLYQWIKNGIPGTTGSSYTYTPANGDSVRCVLTGSSACTMPAATNSNTIVMVVDTLSIPAISVAGPSSVAAGSTFTLTATLTNAGSSYSIDWYNNGTLFATTAAPTVTGTAITGVDAITAQLVQQSFHCNDSAISDTVFIATTDGVGNITAFRFSVYPDPAHSLITITGPGISTVIITNTIGQLQLTKSDVKDTVNIDISALPSGIYLITAIDTNGSRTINKFVKQ